MVYFFSAATGNGITYRGNETAICGCVMVAIFPSFEIRNEIIKYKIGEINSEKIFSPWKYYIQVLFNGRNVIKQTLF